LNPRHLAELSSGRASLLDENPPKFLFLKPNPLMDAMIAQIPQKGKGAAAWVSRPQRGEIRHRPLPGSLGSGPLASVSRLPRSAADLKDFRPGKAKLQDGTPTPPWSVLSVWKFFDFSKMGQKDNANRL